MKKSFLVRRKDTGKVRRIEIEDDKQVYDLLEDAIPLFRFDADAGLSIYREDVTKNISEDTLLRELDVSKMLIVEDTTLAANQTEVVEKKKKDRNQKNMEMAREIKDRVSTKHAPSRDNDFANRFTEQPGLPTEQHDKEKGLLQDLQQRTSTQTGIMSGSSYSSSEDTELLILRRKMNMEGMNGFLYTITPEDYVDHNESSYVERSFSSEQERQATLSKVSTTSDWSSWNAEAGFSGWGVSVSASAGQDRSSTQHAGEKTEETKRGKTAIVTRTSFHHMKKFIPKLRLSGDAVRDAKKIILEADMHSKGDAIAAFDALYCSYAYTGPFLAGGWFSTVATATSTKTMEFSSLAREATSKIETDWAVGASGWGVSSGAGGSAGTSSTSGSQESRQSTTSSVQVTINKESVPGNTCNENDLEQKIKDATNWTVFPVTEVKKVDFIPVHVIMAMQAKEEKDKDLEYVAMIMRMHMKGAGINNRHDIDLPPYVIFLGDVGTGKSTLVEKLSGVKGRSSDANESYTKTSEPYWVPDGSLIICDTPGANSMKEKFEHNIWIAGAVNFRPVSRIFIVVKAETRIDSVVDNVRKYADRFLDLPIDVVGVLVTHMDTVVWTKKEFVPMIDGELGIDVVVCSSITTPGETLLADTLDVCTDTHNLSITHENLLKVFKIHDNQRKILQCTSNEVKRFQNLKKEFDQARKSFTGMDLVDLIFEFQAWMAKEIVEAQMRMADENKFTFYGEGAANEAGHVANMTNQLRMVLYDLRTEALGFQSEHGVSDQRKCPHCGLIWAKIEGCEGSTTCGNRPSTEHDKRNPEITVMGTFTFSWNGWQLDITKGECKQLQKSQNKSKGYGCGQTINWRDMAQVQVPDEFTAAQKVNTDDVKILPPSATGFNEIVDMKLDDVRGKMTLASKPSLPHTMYNSKKGCAQREDLSEEVD